MEQRVDILSKLLFRLIRDERPGDVKTDFSEMLGEINPQELAAAEDQLVSDGISIDEIQRANERHTALVAEHIAQAATSADTAYAPGHPATVFIGENAGIRAFMENQLQPDLARYLETLLEPDRANLLSSARTLGGLIKHYDRKESLFFPYLEKAGITAPPQVMWGVDDIIRDLIRLFIQSIDQQPVNPKRIQMINDRVSAQIENMILKENSILMPMLKPCLSDEDWIVVAQEGLRIGYVLNQAIPGATNSDAVTWLNDRLDGREKDAQGKAVPVESGDSQETKGKICLPSGRFTEAQLTAMLNTLPTDLTFIDSNDVIQYYSEGKHQVFARTRTIIGRNVYLCHPPQLVPTIRALIESFKSGERDAKVVPVRRGSRLDLVRYYAVRDEHGAYLGTVEVTEEISGILNLTSGKTQE